MTRSWRAVSNAAGWISAVGDLHALDDRPQRTPNPERLLSGIAAALFSSATLHRDIASRSASFWSIEAPDAPVAASRRACGKRAERGDELAHYAFMRTENLSRHTTLTPVELTLADETKRIGERVERRAKFLDGEQQLVSREPSLTCFDSRNGLAVQADEIVLREFLFPLKFLQTLSDQWVSHACLCAGRFSLAD